MNFKYLPSFYYNEIIEDITGNEYEFMSGIWNFMQFKFLSCWMQNQWLFRKFSIKSFKCLCSFQQFFPDAITKTKVIIAKDRNVKTNENDKWTMKYFAERTLHSK